MTKPITRSELLDLHSNAFRAYDMRTRWLAHIALNGHEGLDSLVHLSDELAALLDAGYNQEHAIAECTKILNETENL